MRKQWVVVMLVTLFLAGCTRSMQPLMAETPAVPTGQNITPSPTYPCPEPTAELLAVEPLPDQTDQDAITLSVIIGNGEKVVIHSEAGDVVATEGFQAIQVPLKAGVTHHFSVDATVRLVKYGDCTYGGYTLHTATDRTGMPLVVRQGVLVTPLPAGQKISSESVNRLQLLRTLEDTGMVSGLYFIDGHTLVSVGDRIQVWDTATGTLQQTVAGKDGRLYLYASAISPDGKFVAAGGSANEAAVWDLKSGEKVALAAPSTDKLDDLSAMAYNPSGKIVAGADAKALYLWDASSHKSLKTLSLPSSQVMNRVLKLRWWNDNTLMVVMDQSIDDWDVDSGTLIDQAPVPTGSISYYDANFHEQGKFIITYTVTGNEVLHIWNPALETWQMVTAPRTMVSLQGLEFNPDGDLLAVRSDGPVWFFDVKKGAFLSPTQAPSNASNILVFSTDGRMIATTQTQAGRIWLWGIP